MKLTRFKVQNYRNIVDSGWVEMDDIITIVGKNESGKTSLLKALWKFNPYEKQPYSLDREWPRGRRKERSEDQVVVVTEWEFSDEEQKELQGLHESAASIKGVRIERNYKGTYSYTFLPTHPDREHKVDWVVSVIRRHFEKPPEGASAHFKQQFGQALETFIKQVREKGGSEYAVKQAPGFKNSLSGFISPSNPENQQDQQVIPTIHALIDKAVAELSINPPSRRAIDTAHEWLPTFIYMDDYRTFAGRAHLEQVQQRAGQDQATEEDYTIRLIMEQAGLDLDEEVKKGKANDREQRMLDMNDASMTLTNELSHRWSQKQYEVRFTADGQQLIMFVKDANSPALIPLEERSKGFQWFFSFDMLFMAETDGKFENCVILLDEPGLHLHAAAQRDLLQRLKAYAQNNQLIYSTHLPFMLDFNRLEHIYICEEKPDEGVKVHQNWASADKDARFTLLAALGISWSQSLFVGQYNLVVEGVTDFWFLDAFSEMMRQADKAGLDESLVITPAGGGTKAAYIGTILRGQELNVAVLLDSDQEGQNAYEQLVHQWILDDSHVFQLGKVLGEDGNRSLEDLFDEDYYLKFVSEAYKKELGGKALKVPAAAKKSIVERIETALRKEGIETFNKGRVAKRIMKDWNGKNLSDLPKETVERFGRVLEAINDLVGSWRDKG